MHLLHKVAHAGAEGALAAAAGRPARSARASAMTEPDDGAGSDPSLLQTTRARATATTASINGRKWLITGGRAPRSTS